MSSNVLKLIPSSPDFLPPESAQIKAIELLKVFFSSTVDVATETTTQVRFIDAGSNWGRISCPSCGLEIDEEAWQRAMDSAYSTDFDDLSITVSCCGSTLSLNELDYAWPVGFARFVISIRDPKKKLDGETLHLLEQLLGCQLREIQAHY